MFQCYTREFKKQRGSNLPMISVQCVAIVCALCSLGLVDGERLNHGAFTKTLKT